MTLLPPDTAALFHVPGPGPYMAAHAAGCQPRIARERLEQAMTGPWAAQGNAAWDDWLAAVDHFRGALAGLTGCVAADICPQAGVTAGFVRWVGALPLPVGDRRDIVMAPSSFPSLGFAAGGLEQLGYRLRFLPDDGDVRDIATWRDAISEQTAVVLAMHVTSNSGALAPVAEIVAAAHRCGARACIDIAQSVGVVPMHVPDWGADAVIGSSLKWLCGGPGAGFIILRGDSVAALDPIDRGWWSHEAPFEMDIRNFRHAPDALRLWGGTPGIAPFALAAAGIDTIAAIGVVAIRAHNRALQALACDALSDQPWRWPAGDTGGTLCIDVGGDRPRIMAALTRIGAQADFRGDTLRLSFAAWNGADDVAAVKAALA